MTWSVASETSARARRIVRLTPEEFVVSRRNRFGMRGPGESSGPLETLARGRRDCRVGKQLANEIRPGVNVGDRSEKRGRSAGFTQSRNVAGDDWRAARQGLDNWQPKALGITRYQNQRSAPVDLSQDLARESGNVRKRAAQIEPGDLLAVFGGQFTADLEQMEVGYLRANGRDDVEQNVDSLAIDGRADMEHPGPALELGQPGGNLQGTGSLPCEFRSDTERGVHQPVGINQSSKLDFGRDGLGVMKHHGRLSQTPKDLARHRTKPARPLVSFRVDQRPERIDVVTINPCLPGGKGMNELGVRMIGDVKKVEFASHASGVVREENEPIEHPIGVESGLPPTDHRQAESQPTKAGADSRGGQRILALARQMLDQHLGAQIHAPPSLLGKIRENRESMGHRVGTRSRFGVLASPWSAQVGDGFTVQTPPWVRAFEFGSKSVITGRFELGRSRSARLGLTQSLECTFE